MNKIAPPAMAVFNDPKYKSDKWEIRPAGLSYTEYEEEKAIYKQCISRIILGFIVMLFFLIVFIRSLRGILVPSIATIGALCTTLGFSGWMNIKGNNTMILITVLLSMALAVGYAVHYINSFKMHFRRTGNRKESVILGVRDSGWALFFTVITTMAEMLSFLSLF